MAISATVPYGLADFSVNSLKANNVSLVPGVLNYDSASCTALTVTANDIGLTQIQGLIVGFGDYPLKVQRVSDAEWTVQGITLVSSVSGTGGVTFTSTATAAVASATGVPFLAWGYRR